MPPLVVPIFPLPEITFFPSTVLPLHVFEARYRFMMRDVMQADREFGVVLIERGSEVGGGDIRFAVGTLARVVRAEELPDGRYFVAAVGISRIRVEDWLPDDPYPRAHVVDLPDESSGPQSSIRDAVETLLREVLDLWARVDPAVPPIEVALADDPGRAAFEAAALSPIGPLDAQRLLEAPDANARLTLLGGLLVERAELLRAQLATE